jgi:hypothetical protein
VEAKAWYQISSSGFWRFGISKTMSGYYPSGVAWWKLVEREGE